MDQTDAEHDITEKLGQTCACVSEFSDFWSVHRLDDRPKLAKLPNIDAVIHALTYLHDQDAHTTFFVFFRTSTPVHMEENLNCTLFSQNN